MLEKDHPHPAPPGIPEQNGLTIDEYHQPNET